MLKELLLERIGNFLEEKIPCGEDGWAVVSPEDHCTLVLLIEKILELKFEADADGSLPIQTILVDRNYCQPMFYFPTKYPHKIDNIEDAIQSLQNAHVNLNLANGEVSQCVRVLTQLTEDVDKT